MHLSVAFGCRDTDAETACSAGCIAYKHCSTLYWRACVWKNSTACILQHKRAVTLLPRDDSAERGNATVSRLSVRPSVRDV